MRTGASTTTYGQAVGERLREVRTAKRLSLAQVEAASGGKLKAVVVGSWERGDRAVSLDRLPRLAAFYCVPIASFLPMDPPDGGEPAARPEERMGVTYRQLDHWTRQGWLMPTEPTPGTGRAREWPPGEIEIGRRMGRLTAAGFSPERAAQYARDGWPAAEIAPGIRIEVAS